MGSICSMVGANTVVFVKEPVNQLASTLNDAVSGKQDTKSLDVVMKQVIWSATYYSRQNNEPKIHEEHTDLSLLIPSENSKLSLFNESKKHRYLAGVSSQGDWKQTSTNRKSNEYQFDAIVSNRRPTLSNDHHCKTSSERKSSISGKSIIVKNTQTIPNTTNRPIEKDTDDSTKETTVPKSLNSIRISSKHSNQQPITKSNHHSENINKETASNPDKSIIPDTNRPPINTENIHSKRINSGVSNKPPIPTNNSQKQNDHRRKSIIKETAPNLDKSIVPDTTHPLTNTENIHSNRINPVVSNKPPIPTNNPQKRNDHRRKSVNKEATLIPDKSTIVKNTHTKTNTTHPPVGKITSDSRKESTTPESLHSKRSNSGKSNKHTETKNNQQKQNEHHSKHLNEKPASISDKSIILKNNDNVLDTSDEPLKKHIDDAINKATVPENFHSKRINSGSSSKHQIIENSEHRKSCDSSQTLNETTPSISETPTIVEGIHTIPDTTNQAVEEHTDHSMKDPSIPERINSEDSNKHPTTENDHSITLNEKRTSISDKLMIVESDYTIPDTSYEPIKIHNSTEEATIPENLHSKRIDSENSDKHPVTEKQQEQQSGDHSKNVNKEPASTHTVPDSTDDLMKKNIEYPTAEPTILENLHSKRVKSGVSHKHPVTEKQPEQQNDDHSENVNKEPASTHTVPDNSDDLMEKKIEYPTTEPTIPENSHSKRIKSGVSHKHSVTENNEDKENDHHNDDFELSIMELIPDTTDDPMKENMDNSTKSPENSHSKRIKSGDSNKYPITDNNHHRRTSNEKRPSTSKKSTIAEDIHTVPDATDDLMKKKTPSPENLHTKRTDSGVSRKHSATKSNEYKENDHHSKNVNESKIEENSHTIPNTTDPVMKEPKIFKNSHSKRINSGDSKKSSVTENNHHRKSVNKEVNSSVDESTVEESAHTTPDNLRKESIEHSTKNSTSPVNSLSKRINSGDSNKSATVEDIRTVPDMTDHLVKDTINPSRKEQTSPENVYLTRTNSRDSNKVPITESDYHGKKLNEKRPSTSNKSMRGENNHTISDDTHPPVEKHNNHSTRESTASPESVHSKRSNSGVSNKYPKTENHEHMENLDTTPGPIEKQAEHLIKEPPISENWHSKRTHSGDSNKHPITENNAEKKDDHHGTKSNERKTSIPNKSIVVESTHSISDTTDQPSEEHANRSRKGSTTLENLQSKRMSSGNSRKHSVTENSEQHQNDHHSKNLNDKRPSISTKSLVVESIRTTPDSTHRPLEENTNHSRKESIVPENLQLKRMSSGDSRKHSITGNNQHHQNDKRPSIADNSMVIESIHTILDPNHRPVEKHTDHSTKEPPTIPKRIDSGPVNRYPLSARYTVDRNGLIDSDTTVPISKELLAYAGISELPTVHNKHVDIVDIHPEAFNDTFVQQRQDAINNRSHRSTIESWKPNSLQELIQAIKDLSKEKSLIDCHWIIFYWIALNIEYDAVSFLNDTIPSQLVKAVFRTKKGVSAGYSHLYKYLCDKLGMKCVELNGYAKGYAFEKRKQGIRLQKDHSWNAAQINDHWYLIDVTWGAGHLTEQNIFKRELDPFYFLAHPQQMIYHHLPEDSDWQLLRTPIDKIQYEQMPKIRPPYFNLHLELVSPLHQEHVSLVRDKPYALILIRAPTDVDLLGSLKLNGKKIEGGHRIIFDRKKQLYRCYFAPVNIGEHQVCLYAKNVNSAINSYELALDFTLNVDRLPKNPISYPTMWKKFYDLDLKVVSPVNTHLIKVADGATHALVIIQAPNDVELIGNLRDSSGTKIEGGEQVYFDREKSLWKCSFAPNQNGLFEANIFGKKNSKTDNYSSIISFKIEASQIPSPPLSYPQTWQLFHDLNLKVKAPRNCSTVPWPENASYAEVLIRAPDDVQLSCKITHKNVDINNGSLAQFDHDKRLWQLLFAPQSTGEHDLVVFAKRISEENAESSVLKFRLNVTHLNRSTKFPTVHEKFYTHKCRIYEPLNGILKKGTTVPIHCIIPGANDVKLTVDSNWVKVTEYQDPVFKQNIIVGSKEVTIYANYGEKSSYDGLVEYSVI